jgi:hypothetical protein
VNENKAIQVSGDNGQSPWAMSQKCFAFVTNWFEQIIVQMNCSTRSVYEIVNFMSDEEIDPIPKTLTWSGRRRARTISFSE